MVDLYHASRRLLSLDDRKRIILARYGSLEDFSRVRKTLTQIHKRFRVPVCTIHKLLNAFEQRGCNLDLLGRKYERYKMLAPRLQDMLLDERLLQSWIPMTTRERSRAIFDNFGVRISPTHLRRFYREHGVKYQTGKTCFKAALTFRDDLEARRRTFALLLANIVAQRKPIIYVDETSFRA